MFGQWRSGTGAASAGSSTPPAQYPDTIGRQLQLPCGEIAMVLDMTDHPGESRSTEDAVSAS
ncbi:hypothetical protein AS594_09920 [Streptomyces agglomeratus]|uniref:Uncharacterized protein n=1 Tax=Streptomyces agglomeratus TaxID=285458 RepID=A0A1E5P5F0_9ACTN|nr:hypothetical protein AS594_09920 [Streptomyces agglomeratus]OEJ53782.1 hypothetical protein BGK72_26285 [Streptomyces agglomeratus]